MEKTKKVIQMIRFNWRAIIGFELIYKLASTVVFIPLFWKLFQLLMKIRGYAYLSFENIVPFLLHPISVLFLLFLFLLMTLYTMIDIAAVIFTLDQSYQKKRIYLWQVIKYAAEKGIRVFRAKNIFLAVTVLLLIPFLNVGVAAGFIGTISIPEFVMDYIRSNQILTVLLGVILAILSMRLLKWLYAFHYYVLENCDFKTARKKSINLSKKNTVRDFRVLVGIQLICSILYVLFLFSGLFLVLFLGKLCSKWFAVNVALSSFVWLMMAVSLVIYSAMETPVCFACIGILFYQKKKENKERVLHCSAPFYMRSGRYKSFMNRLQAVSVLFLMATGLFIGYQIYSGNMSLEVEYIRAMEVTAHRGASAYYPENTMAAFYGAKKLGADWIELDVQQSRDGQIFVMHDTNFKRTTGVNQSSWEMDYDEICKLDAGSYFGKEFAGEPIPLLSEVIDFAKEYGIKLNIELKPTGHETDFETSVVDIIRSADFADSCVVASQIYQVLEHVKAYDEEVTTVYVMSLAYGNINQLTAADSFSLEASSATKAMVNRIHNEGKQIFAWTVNTQQSIKNMISLNVDNIITDDIALARQCIEESRYSNIVNEFMKRVMGKNK